MHATTAHHDETPLRTADLDYTLPEGFIATHPPRRREDARMLGLDRATGCVRDGWIKQLPDHLEPHDLLVLNDTKVLPASFTARRRTGGTVPALFVAEEEPGVWRVMLRRSRRLRVGEILSVTPSQGNESQAARARAATACPGPQAVDIGAEDDIGLELLASCGQGHWRARIRATGSVEQILDRIGHTPLPPYIRRSRAFPGDDIYDRSRYQTVFAKKPGAIAAPTAGLHLTGDLLNRIRRQGVVTTFVTLHVGVGTFTPISVERISDHIMHAERYELSEETAEAVRACRRRRGRVVAVGTTSVRALESAAGDEHQGRILRAGCGSTNLFIHPPYMFRVVDALLTNFHLPRSTLLALVMAFAGVERVRRAYQHAIEKGYRFYSYGDAMLIQ